jgi:Platelet-activating factor acetylhydrolase, isoform II
VGQAERSPTAGAPVANTAGVQEGGPTRRLFLGAGAATLGLAAAGCGATPAARKPRARLQLTLFPPTGPYPVGTVPVHLVDRSRRDPWVPARPRELMVSIWYPAQDAGRYPRAPWMPEAAGALFLNQLIPSLMMATGKRIRTHGQTTPSPVSLHGVRLPVTRARLGAPVDQPARRHPVVLYQPGYGDPRELGTGLVSDLASRGYVVVTIDDTYEAAEVEFPNRRIATPRRGHYEDTVRIADTRFVLDELAALESGVNPGAEHRPLPAGLAKALDLTEVGMFGHSLGGATAAKAMAADARIGAGINLDGSLSLLNPSLPADPREFGAALARKIGGRPFMIMSSHGFGPWNDPSWSGFWPSLQGWRLFLTLKNSQHYSYTDLEEFLSQLRAAGVISSRLAGRLVTSIIGTIDPAGAVAAERAYIGAFFDLHLRGQASKLLDHPSPDFPDIQFLGR